MRIHTDVLFVNISLQKGTFIQGFVSSNWLTILTLNMLLSGCGRYFLPYTYVPYYHACPDMSVCPWIFDQSTSKSRCSLCSTHLYGIHTQPPQLNLKSVRRIDNILVVLTIRFRDENVECSVNFPSICSNIPESPAYVVYISQLIRYQSLLLVWWFYRQREATH